MSIIFPFYRQVKQLHHLGFKASESTIDGWFKPAVELLKPLYEVLRQEIMKSDYIQDETTVPVPGQGRDIRPTRNTCGWSGQ